jgi:hypothetical protein
MAAGLGFKDFTTGEVLTANDVDGYLMQGIWVFASAAARDAAVTSPQEGNACYLKDTDAVMTYSGSAWVAVGGSAVSTGLVFLNKTDFTASSAVNINNVFSTTYDNYKIMIVGTSTTANKGQATIKMRVSGADTSTNYTNEKLAAYDANVIAARNEKGTDEGYIGDIAPLDESDVISLDVYRPFLTKETTWIGHNFSTQDTFLVLSGFSQTDKTSFTGFTALFTETSTGSIYSYGYAKA